MSEVQVRACKMADEEAVLKLARREMQNLEVMDRRLKLSEDAADRYTVYLRDRLRDLDTAVFVAEREEAIVGLAIATIRRHRTLFAVQRYGYISDLVVAPEARRAGIGKLLFERIGVWLRGHGLQVTRLHVAVRNRTGRAFWEKLGAEEFMTEMWLELPAMSARAGVSTGAAPAAQPRFPAPDSAEPSPAAAEDPSGDD